MRLANVTKSVLPSILLVCFTSTIYSRQIAFPGAEGYGKYASGGRGGKVYEVTTLKSSGPGSLGEAIGASGPRTVVFRVSGTIEGNFRINSDKITIAGQTAPGDGICIKGSLRVDVNDVIIRYIRVRANPAVGQVDAIYGEFCKNVILDHVSASWSSDEVVSLYRNENITIQWCMITEACANEGGGHRFGGIWGNNYSTYHHNLLAHNDSRNPRWGSGTRYNDYRNNVLYNWGYNSCYGGEAVEDSYPDVMNFFTVNMVANYYKPGPATRSNVARRIARPGANDLGGLGKWYVSDNYIVGYPEVTANNWLGVDNDDGKRLYEPLSAPWDAMPINQESPEEAYQAVLEHVGCSLPKRDAIDTRIIEEVRTGTATYGNNGIITRPSDVGGWPNLQGGPAPVDSDHDGIPDAWETAHGLDPSKKDDGNKTNLSADSYTNLESYLNSLVM